MASKTVVASDPEREAVIELPAAPEQAAHGYWASAWQRLRRDVVAMFGSSLLLFVIAIVLLAPVLPLADPTPTQLNTEERLLPMFSEGHILGTDQLGRDILSRLIWGGRLSLLAGLLATLISLGIGAPIGLISGYFDNWVGGLLMRFIDILMAFPPIVLAIVIVTILGPGLFNAMVAVGLVGVALYARLIRATVQSTAREGYVEAARAAGATQRRIVFRHIVPNILAPIIVTIPFNLASNILATASLSFVGLGTQPPTPDWGNMLAEGRRYMTSGPHLSLVPGMAIFIVVVAANLLGDGLRDALDPTMVDA